MKNLTPKDRNEWIDSVSNDLSKLSEIAIRIDAISPETMHSIEMAETPDEKANAIHAAIAEAMNARAVEKTE